MWKARRYFSGFSTKKLRKVPVRHKGKTKHLSPEIIKSSLSTSPALALLTNHLTTCLVLCSTQARGRKSGHFLLSTTLLLRTKSEMWHYNLLDWFQKGCPGSRALPSPHPQHLDVARSWASHRQNRHLLYPPLAAAGSCSFCFSPLTFFTVLPS